MTISQTTNLHLTKAVKGTAEPFSIDAVNANLDAIDGAVGDLQESVSQLETWQDESSGVYCTKIGKLVIMKLYSSGPVQLDNMSNQITTLPSGWRPATDSSVGFCEVNGNAVQLLVYTDGLVTVWNNLTAITGYLRGFIAYFTV